MKDLLEKNIEKDRLLYVNMESDLLIDSENIQIFISGSSSKLLSKEIATGLRGRTIPYYVYPFSFREFLRAKDFKIETYLSTSQKSQTPYKCYEACL